MTITPHIVEGYILESLNTSNISFFWHLTWIFAGLLGSITKTADVSECPGKCLHALSSLLCEEVREDIQCPAQSMRCCVDRGNKPKPSPPNDLSTSESRPETSTKRVRPPPPKTNRSTTTTTKPPTTTKRAVASDKQDKFGDYEYVDSSDSDGTSDSASRFSSMTTSAFLISVLSIFSSAWPLFIRNTIGALLQVFYLIL